MSTKLPRIPGFKYGPHVHRSVCGKFYRVAQIGFWQDARVCGPYKPTEAEAIKAWKRLVRKATGKKAIEGKVS